VIGLGVGAFEPPRPCEKEYPCGFRKSCTACLIDFGQLTRSNNPGSLFRTFPTRSLTGQARMTSAG
jgi:hypothetical protein